MGERISNAVEQFYCLLIENEDIRKMKIYDILNRYCMEFYNVCARFADIFLNAHKYRITGNCDIQVCFQIKDIEAAKWVARSFYLRRSIEDADELLKAIQLMYRMTVNSDDTRCSSAPIKEKNGISHEGDTVEELIKNFKETVDAYLEDCQKDGVEPEQTINENDDLALHIPNEETIAAMEEVDEMKKNPSRYKSYANVEELMEDLLKEDEVNA